MAQAHPDSSRRGQKVQQTKRRHDQISLHHLNIETKTNPDGAQQQPAQFARLRRAYRRPGSQQHGQNQRAINRVIAARQHANRTDSQSKSGQQTCYHAKMTAHQPVEQQHGQDTGQRLRKEHTKSGKAEYFGAGSL